MATGYILLIVLGLAVLGFFLGRSRALSMARESGRRLHSLPNYYGQAVALVTAVPALFLLAAWLFLQPLLTGAPLPLVKARLAAPLPANGPREQYMRAAISLTDGGVVMAHAAANQDSSLITPFIRSAGLIRRLPGAPGMETGQVVDCILIRAPRWADQDGS